MAVSSYGAATQTSGVVRILKDLDHDLEGLDVLLVEDIIDSGLTLNYLLKNLRARKPASLEVAALLRKVDLQRVPLDIRYTGFEIPNEFVVGYGLDYRGAVPEPALHRHTSSPRPTAGPDRGQPSPTRRRPRKMTRLTASLLFASLVLLGCHQQAPAGTGIRGVVTLGPACPVETVSSPCPDVAVPR